MKIATSKIHWLVLLISIYSFLVYAEEYNEDSLWSEYFVRPRFGIFGSYGANLHFGNFRSLPKIPCCSPKFNFGGGFGWEIGALGEYFLNPELSIGAKLSIFTNDAAFRKEEPTTVIVDGVSAEGLFEHKLQIDLKYLSFGIFVNYYLLNDFWLSGGLGISVPIDNRFSQYEKIVKPSDRGVFPNGLRVRNDTSGSIPEIRGSIPFLFFSIKREFIVHERGAFILSPEFSVRFHFINAIRGISLLSSQLRLGLNLMYRQPIPPPPPPPPPMNPPFPELPTPMELPKINAAISYKFFDSSNYERTDFPINIEDFVSLNMKPLLNYIFFEHNSAEIPNRYIKLTRKEAEKFDLKNLAEQDVLKTYYNVLNIVGKKLREDPSSQVTLVGTNSNKDEEKNNLELSRQRAEAVKNYLIETWGIEPDRIKVEYRNLPKEYSNPRDPLGDEENRRVEIYSDNLRILEPIITIDTLRKVEKARVVFYPEARAESGIRQWKLIVRQDDEIVKQFGGIGNFPKQIEWRIEDNAFERVVFGGKLDIEFFVLDSLGQQANASAPPIKVNKITVERKRREGVSDKEYEYYSLILFDFGKTKLERQHKSVLDFINNRITPNSQITIEGYTDQIGDVKTNLKISEKRAREAAKWLGLPNARTVGVGEQVLLYDNNLPEGRFYCRTVKITIETPVVRK